MMGDRKLKRTGKTQTGRPTKLTAARLKRIEEALRLGASYRLAANLAGVSESTFYRWLEASETAKPGTLMARFWVSVTKASAQGGLTNLKRIDAAGEEGDVRAAMWILERRFPKDYGKRLEVRGIPTAEVAEMVAELLSDAQEVLPPDLYEAMLERWSTRVATMTGDM